MVFHSMQDGLNSIKHICIAKFTLTHSLSVTQITNCLIFNILYYFTTTGLDAINFLYKVCKWVRSVSQAVWLKPVLSKSDKSVLKKISFLSFFLSFFLSLNQSISISITFKITNHKTIYNFYINSKFFKNQCLTSKSCMEWDCSLFEFSRLSKSRTIDACFRLNRTLSILRFKHSWNEKYAQPV